jgi:hypothetical protein
MTYMRLAQREVGLLMNFNVLRLIDGIIRKAFSKPLPLSASSAPLR